VSGRWQSEPDRGRFKRLVNLWHTGRMPTDPFTLRQADQARTDFAIIDTAYRLARWMG